MYTISKYYTIVPKRSENLRILITVCGKIIQNQSCMDNKYGSLIIQFILFSLQMEDLKMQCILYLFLNSTLPFFKPRDNI